MFKNGERLCGFILILLVCAASQVNAAGSSERVLFNENWRFQKGDPSGKEGVLAYEKIKDWVRASGNEYVLTPNAAKGVRPTGNVGEDVPFTRQDFDDSAWRALTLPHDWGIEGDFQQDLPGETGKLPWAGVGWYRKHFNVSPNDKGQQIYLDIDGAMAYPEIWLNGQFVGGWTYGYSSFRLDLTPYIKYGSENVIAIRLDNPPESSRWYPGSGIYRNVWLVKTAPVHIAHWGTYITTPEVTKGSARVNVKTTLENDASSAADLKITASVFATASDGQKIGKAITSSAPLAVDLTSHTSKSTELDLVLKNPRLWNLMTPNLYTLVVNVSRAGKLIDSQETRFGVRTIRFDPEKGFFLNGEHVYIKGVCDHADLGPLGTAINTRGLERQVELLKEMGANAIRTSHNPPAPELLDLCDRMGMLVMDEGFDMWVRGKKKNDNHLVFDDWGEKDWRSQIRRDRNHPSVILWSIGNEIGEQRRPELHHVAAELTAIAHEEDPTRPTIAACNTAEAGFNGFQKTIDVFGYNYRYAQYTKFHEANPNMPLLASETASTVSSRGEYFFPVENDKSKGRADFQVSSYDLYAPPWATPPDTEFEAQDQNPFVAGEFVWTGFDYLGEPTPYGSDTTNLLNFSDPREQSRMAEELKQLGKIAVPSRSSYFGIFDLDGFKKDRFYIYQARWRPNTPMAHILPHWNWPERVGKVTPVHVYTSGDEAELFLNGRSLGRKKREAFQYRLRWDDVVYEPGELRVVAYKNGKKWAEDVVRTTGKAEKLSLLPDRKEIKADGFDLSYITVSVEDANGSMVPRSHNSIRFDISGPAEIVAVDNGDATDHTSFQSRSRKAFNGLCLVIVRSLKNKSGRITVRAVSDGLRPAETFIVSK
ncbi:MAG TPA: beta-galactosidase GalB [Pyrinomonadaceae bacterium]|nr:beta-galactosidase GalB [Pyrinomonadaceae bacterium]